MKLVKDVIKVADYRPNPLNRDFVVPVTHETLDHWTDTFGKMKQAGIRIPVPWEHPPKTDPHTNPIEAQREWSSRREGDPRSNAGWVEHVYKDGDTLMAVLDVPDECGKDLKEKGCYVSPKFGGLWRDSLDREWKNPIYHIALTTKPVAVNQSREFKEADPTLAFSRELCFSTTAWDQQSPENEMDLSPEEAIDRILENPDVLARAAEKLGLQEFSANPGAPGGMPQPQPVDQYAAAPTPADDDTTSGVSGNAVAMKVLHAIMNACTEGLKILAGQAGASMDDEDEDDTDQGQVPTPQVAPQVTATPAVVSMSREEDETEMHEFSIDDVMGHPLFKAMEKKLTGAEQEKLISRVDALFETARIDKPSADELKGRIGTYQFSRQGDTDNVLLIKEIEILEKLREGAATKTEATEFSRKPNVVPHNEQFNSEEDVSDDRADEILAKHYPGYKPKTQNK